MDLAQRKKIELKQKLASLQIEFQNWREQSKASKPLEKHQSQIHRVTLQLEGLNNQIDAELDKLGNAGPAVLSAARDLELAMLEMHRVWEFFRSKLSLRSIEWFSKYLIAADELAWECYSAAQKELNPNYLSPEKVKEPPLVFFNGGSSPFTLPRDFAFKAEDVAGESIKSERVGAVLRALPIPVIGVPWFQIQHLPEMLVVTHEVGHDVESDFGLTGDLTNALDKALDEAKTDNARRPAWHAWMSEIFADMYGVQSCGPAFVQSLINFLATDQDKTRRAVRVAPKWGRYPTDHLRVLLNIEALDVKEFSDERDELAKQWQGVYSEQHAMPEYVADIAPVVAAMLNGPCAAFSGKSLNQVIWFTQGEQYYVRTDVNRLSQGAGPQATNVRTLFAAVSTVFSNDAEQYGKLKLHDLVLDHVPQIRQAGVRGSETTLGTALGTFDEQDETAGHALFSMVFKKHQG